jgi:branched-chain amino acid transport system substrate-binding protein
MMDWGTRPRLLLAIFVAIALAAVGAGCGGDDDEGGGGTAETEEPIVIGESIGESGFLTAFDLPPSAGAHIAADEINAQGGVEGRKIVFKTIDNQSEANQAFTAAKSLVDQGAQILLGSCNFEQGQPTARVANQDELVMFSYCGGEPRLTQQVGDANTFTFDMGNETNGVGASMAAFAYKKGFRNVYLLKDTSINYSQQMCDFFDRSWTENPEYSGTSIIATDTFKNEDPSIATQISRIKSSSTEPDAIVLCSYLPGGATALRQMRAAGIDTPVVTGDGMDGTSLFEAVPNLSDFYESVAASVYGDDPEPQVQELVDKYKARTGKDPEGSYLVFGYSIIQAIQAAVEETGGSTNGPELRDALESFRNEPLLVGPMTFTETQHVDPFRPE